MYTSLCGNRESTWVIIFFFYHILPTGYLENLNSSINAFLYIFINIFNKITVRFTLTVMWFILKALKKNLILLSEKESHKKHDRSWVNPIIPTVTYPQQLRSGFSIYFLRLFQLLTFFLRPSIVIFISFFSTRDVNLTRFLLAFSPGAKTSRIRESEILNSPRATVNPTPINLAQLAGKKRFAPSRKRLVYIDAIETAAIAL